MLPQGMPGVIVFVGVGETVHVGLIVGDQVGVVVDVGEDVEVHVGLGVGVQVWVAVLVIVDVGDQVGVLVYVGVAVGWMGTSSSMSPMPASKVTELPPSVDP